MSDPLWELARQYAVETERYDRTVCTGRIIRGAIAPASYYEMGRCSRNASQVRARLEPHVRHIGHTWRDLVRVTISYENSQQYLDDMTTEGLMRYTPPHGN